ncbi:MAG TPA: FAD-binding oxidoreductase [Terriglobales bacterium]|nr:FAD-binding oxidoreductase [Terriglobales bacterium]
MDTSKYLAAEITARQDLSADLWTMRMRLPSPFVFQPGQYATLALEDASGVHERPYSIVSSPAEAELEFFFELVPHGEVTPRLYQLRPGDTVYVRKSAKGLFVLDRKRGHAQHLLVSTVTGVAPFVSMLRSWARDGAWAPPATRMVLIHAGSRSWEFGYADELRQLAARLPGVQLVLSVSRHWEDADWTGERGRAEDLIRKYADAAGFCAGQTAAYLCGHPQMIENAKGMLTRCGFPKHDLHEEIYFILPKAAAQGNV